MKCLLEAKKSPYTMIYNTSAIRALRILSAHWWRNGRKETEESLHASGWQKSAFLGVYRAHELRKKLYPHAFEGQKHPPAEGKLPPK